MKQHPVNPDALDLEEAFFAKENEHLLKKLRANAQREEQREALRLVVHTTDDAFLDHLLDLGIRPETALAVTLIPLAAVAWADGKIDPPERDAILKAAGERGIEPGTPARQLLETWLSQQPGTSIIEGWKRYVSTIWSDLTDSERAMVHERMMGRARDVAEASGGFLGLTSKISAAEHAVLEDLQTAFT